MFVVMLGRHFRETLSEGTQIKQIEEIVNHPGFDPDRRRGLINDISLMKLRTKAELTEWVQPICLPDMEDARERSSFNMRSQAGIVLGWGYFNDLQLLEELNSLVLPLRPNDFCSAGGKLQLTPQMFCAGDSLGTKAVCKGDSGGPWVRQHPVTEHWIVEGVVSFKLGRDCGTTTFFAVFTRVDKFTEWIKQTTAE